MAKHATLHDCNKECPPPCPLLPTTGESDSRQSTDLPLSEEQTRHLLAGYNLDKFIKKLQSAEGPETFSSILQQFQGADTRHQASQILIADYERQVVHIRVKCEEIHKANKLMTDRLDRISGKLIATEDSLGETKDRQKPQATPASHPVLNAQSCGQPCSPASRVEPTMVQVQTADLIADPTKYDGKGSDDWFRFQRAGTHEA